MGADFLSYLQSGMPSGSSGATQMSGAFTTVLNPNTTGAQKVEGVANAASNLLIGQLLANVNADKDAENQVKQNDSEVDNINKAKDTAAQKNQENVQKILDGIEENYKKAKEKLQELDDLHKEKKDIEDELEKAYAIIETNKRKINGPEQQAALDAIKKASETITALKDKLVSLTNAASQTQGAVQDINKDNNNAQADAEDKTNEGTQEQKAYAADLTKKEADNTQLAASAAQNTQAAVQAEAQAAALRAGGAAGGILSFGATTAAAEAQAAKLDMAAASNTEAAGIKTTGTARTATNIAGGIQGISGNIGNGTEFLNTLIGSANDSNSICFNVYDATNSIGSELTQAGEDVQTDSQNLQAATASAQQQIASNGSNGEEKPDENVTFDFEQEYNVA